jgi:hypothetical protein
MTAITPTIFEPTPTESSVGLCLDCNYPLQHLASHRCPECGRPFDPDEPTTMNMGRPLGAFAKFALGPIRPVVRWITAAAVGFTLWTARLPGGRWSVPWAAVALLVGIGTLWLVWPLLRMLVARHRGWTRQQLTRGRRSRVIVGALVLLTAGVVVLNLPFKLAMALSRPAMDRLATEVLHSPDTARADRWVGLYKAKNIHKVPGGVKFTVEDPKGGGYTAGFVYLPKVDPAKAKGWRAYQFAGGAWWTWWEEG